MKKAIIFDLYDTLIKVHTKTNPYLYMISTCKGSMRYNTKTIINHLLMEDYTTPELIQYFDLDLDVDEFHKMINKELNSCGAISGTYRVLTKLKEKYKLFLLSNVATPYKSPYYKLHLDIYFEKEFFSCDEKDKKPNASFYQKVLDYSGLKKEELIMIGDNPISDYRGAREFGIDAILRDPNASLDILTKDLINGTYVSASEKIT